MIKFLKWVDLNIRFYWFTALSKIYYYLANSKKATTKQSTKWGKKCLNVSGQALVLFDQIDVLEESLS